MVLTAASSSPCPSPPPSQVQNSAMVLDGNFNQQPPKRGTTLPMQNSPAHHPRAGRSNTLPSYESVIRTTNNNNAFVEVPIVSRNAPASVSILSLPTSEDNEVFNFDNRYYMLLLHLLRSECCINILAPCTWRMTPAVASICGSALHRSTTDP